VRVIVGLSGGVDSSVAALLLARGGNAVQGLFMHNWRDDERAPSCRAEDDRHDAVAVAGRLGIPFHVRDFSAEYWDDVFTQFLAGYAAGRTPNPDVLCNREIKFRRFLDAARALGAEKIATGHYARVRERDGRHQLLRGIDAGKDQSYFLHALGQAQLAATLFPLGELRKTDVRRLAREAGLPTHDKKDSTGICFIGERDFRGFLARYLPARPGPIRTPEGRMLGEHSGIMYYTLGQRQGLGLGGVRGATERPWYVIGKETASNTLIVAQDEGWLQARRLTASALTWVDGSAPAPAFNCSAKTRYRQDDQACEVHVESTSATVRFDAPQRAVTPGQAVVFYDGDRCLGGGTIEKTDAAFGGLEPER
jgi:tRNA-specific 2-thiouridylase